MPTKAKIKAAAKSLFGNDAWLLIHADVGGCEREGRGPNLRGVTLRGRRHRARPTPRLH